MLTYRFLLFIAAVGWSATADVPYFPDDVPFQYYNGLQKADTAAKCDLTTHTLCKDAVGRCIPLDWLCDGDDDCGDNSDESGCAYFECRLYTKRPCKAHTEQKIVLENLLTQKDCQWRCAQERFCYGFETRAITSTGESITVYTHSIEEPEDCQFTTAFFTKLWAGGSTAATTVTTTTQPTTTVTFQPAAKNVAFNTVINNPYNTAGGTVPFVPAAGTDNNNHFNPTTNTFPVVAGGIYFVQMCAAVNAGQKANIRLSGSSPVTLGVTWDATIQNGVETQCSSGLTTPANGATLGVVLDNGAVYSNPNSLTTFTSFSVSSSMSADAVSRTVFAVGAPNPPMGRNGTLTPLPMTTIISPTDPTVFNAQTATYTCKKTQAYYVSATVGAVPHAATGLEITNEQLPVALTRSSLQYDGVTSLSREAIITCTAGKTIQLNILYGTVNNSDGVNPYNLTTFTVIPYDPVNVPGPVVWAAYKWYISFQQTDPSDPFYFSNITTNQGNTFDANTNTITVQTAGYYYISFSSGAGVGSPEAGGYKTYQLSLMKGTTVLFAIEHLSSSLDASDVFVHGGIVHLNKGDQLRAVGAADSYFYSSITGYQTSFLGMLLYAD